MTKPVEAIPLPDYITGGQGGIDQSQYISCKDCGNILHAVLGTFPWHECNRRQARNVLMCNKGKDYSR
jgi:hypothetical protein